jgi:hypothetical protein
MQIRNHPKPLGMTGMSNALDTLWTHPERVRVRVRAPAGGKPRRRTMRKHLTFFGQKFAHPHPPPLSDVSHNSSEVDIGVYG